MSGRGGVGMGVGAKSLRPSACPHPTPISPHQPASHTHLSQPHPTSISLSLTHTHLSPTDPRPHYTPISLSPTIHPSLTIHPSPSASLYTHLSPYTHLPQPHYTPISHHTPISLSLTMPPSLACPAGAIERENAARRTTQSAGRHRAWPPPPCTSANAHARARKSALCSEVLSAIRVEGRWEGSGGWSRYGVEEGKGSRARQEWVFGRGVRIDAL